MLRAGWRDISVIRRLFNDAVSDLPSAICHWAENRERERQCDSANWSNCSNAMGSGLCVKKVPSAIMARLPWHLRSRQGKCGAAPDAALWTCHYAKPGIEKLIRVDFHGGKEVPTGTCNAILKAAELKGKETTNDA
jgi:hypothetical protein